MPSCRLHKTKAAAEFRAQETAEALGRWSKELQPYKPSICPAVPPEKAPRGLPIAKSLPRRPAAMAGTRISKPTEGCRFPPDIKVRCIAVSRRYAPSSGTQTGKRHILCPKESKAKKEYQIRISCIHTAAYPSPPMEDFMPPERNQALRFGFFSGLFIPEQILG